MAIDGQRPANTVPSKRAKLVLIYMLTGPPIGGVLFYISMLAIFHFAGTLDYQLGNSISEVIQTLSAFAGGFILVIIISYAIGGVQALMTGVFIAATSGPDGKFGIIPAVIAPTLVGAVAAPLFSVTLQFPLEFGVLLGAIGIAASLIVRFLFRNRFG